jgi:hypothetical protein
LFADIKQATRLKSRFCNGIDKPIIWIRSSFNLYHLLDSFVVGIGVTGYLPSNSLVVLTCGIKISDLGLTIGTSGNLTYL